MTRALRPNGIEWPVDNDGKATNRLELLTSLNGVDHLKAHDALSDITATIAVARLIKEKQPQLYDYLLKLRDKNAVKKLVNLDDKKPFVYTSGRYDSEHDKTTVAFPLTSGRNSNVVVYDLRYDPAPFIKMSQKELASSLFASWEERKAEDYQKLPIKELQYNRAPAVAPLGVLEQGNGWERIHLTPDVVEQHKAALLAAPAFAETIRTLLEGRPEFKKLPDAEAQLYDGFVSDKDRIRIEAVRNAGASELADFHPEFIDERLPALLLRYKARNFPDALSESEAAEWEAWRSERIKKQLPGFMKSLQRLATSSDESKQFLLQELQLWAESLIPEES
jgi:exodeoxyribonuclease-1